MCDIFKQVKLLKSTHAIKLFAVSQSSKRFPAGNCTGDWGASNNKTGIYCVAFR